MIRKAFLFSLVFCWTVFLPLSLKAIDSDKARLKQEALSLDRVDELLERLGEEPFIPPKAVLQKVPEFVNHWDIKLVIIRRTDFR